VDVLEQGDPVLDVLERLAEPISTGPSRALWTRPESSAGVALQLIEPPS